MKKRILIICLCICLILFTFISSGCNETKIITWEKDANSMQSSIPPTNRDGKSIHLAGDEKEIIPNVGIKF
ncbi:MAG: hypothetical protein AABW67_01725 [Nanoarchaeota archaeon]